MDQDRRAELLRTDRPDQLRTAVEDLRRHGSAADWDDLVVGFAVHWGNLRQVGRPGPLSARYGGQVPARMLTVTSLAAAAPAGTKAASIGNAIRRLTVSGGTNDATYVRRPDLADRTVDVTALAGLRGLRELTVEHVDHLVGLPEVIEAGRLVTLSLSKVPLVDLDLSSLTRLETVRLTSIDGLTRLTGLAPSVRDLTLDGVPTTALIELGAPNGLERLAISDPPLLCPVTALRRLRQLTLGYGSLQRDLSWLAALSARSG
jgi:hypothetical protein